MANDFRYDYSFKARLHRGEDLSKGAYNSFLSNFYSYGMKVSFSWGKVRVYYGRETYAYMAFRGRKLAVYFNLNPKDYIDSKYRGEDVSDKKVYEKTPFQMKVTSNRKIKYINELIDFLCKDLGKMEVSEITETYKELTDEEMVNLGIAKKVYLKSKKKIINLAEEIEETVIENVVEAKTEEKKEIVKETVEENLEFKHIRIFNKYSRRFKASVNLSDIDKHFEEQDLINIDTLKDKGLVDYYKTYVKVLGRFGLSKKLKFDVDDYSKHSINLIKEVGGYILK